MTGAEISVACRPDAMTVEQRRRYSIVRQELSSSVLETQELPGGYAFEYPADVVTVLLVAEFITLERLCCPFFRFTLELTGIQDTVWLKLTGDEAAKGVLEAEFRSARG